jgi:hypothetical protein
MYDFILYIFHATVLYSKGIKTKLLHITAFYLQLDEHVSAWFIGLMCSDASN